MRYAIAVCMIVVFGFSGCATVMNEYPVKKVSFTSTPPGAVVSINGFPSGYTPCEIALSKTVNHHIEIGREGYYSRYFMLNSYVDSGWAILDTVFGFAPAIIDAFTKAWYTFDNDKFNAILQPAR